MSTKRKLDVDFSYGFQTASSYEVPRDYFTEIFHISHCSTCRRVTIWKGSDIIYPTPIGIEPCEDMPEPVKELFVEAMRIAYLSPRSACALLRGSIERLCNVVAELYKADQYDKSAWLKNKIKSLHLPQELEDIFMTVKDVGDSGVHGNTHKVEIDFSGRDSVEVALNSAQLVNALVQMLISPFVVQKKLQESFKKK